MTRLLLLFAIIGVTHTQVLAQRVLYSSKDLNRPDAGRVVRNVRPNWRLASTVTVLYKNGGREKIARRTIWGYQDRWKRVYRYYRGSFYELVDTGELVRYNRDAIVGNGVLTEVRYFSKTLDSNVRRTKRRARRDVAAL